MVKFITFRPRPLGQRTHSVPIRRFGSRVMSRNKRVFSQVKKFRKSNLRTKSKQKQVLTRKKLNNVHNSRAGTVSHSSTNFGRHKPLLTKGERVLLGNTTISFNKGERWDGTTGKLTVSNGHNLLDYTTCNGILGNFYSFDSLNPAGTLLSQTSASKLLITDVFEEQLYTNVSNNMIKMEIWDCIARKDCGDANILSGSQAIGEGFKFQGTSNAATGQLSDEQVYGMNPYQSKTFTKYWKVVKTNTVYIGPGGNHTHKIYFKPNWCYSLADFLPYPGASNVTMVKGKTIVSFLIITGFPDNGAGNKASANVTIGSHSIDLCYKQVYSVRKLQANRDQYNLTNNLPTALTGAEEILGEYTDTALTYATA